MPRPMMQPRRPIGKEDSTRRDESKTQDSGQLSSSGLNVAAQFDHQIGRIHGPLALRRADYF